MTSLSRPQLEQALRQFRDPSLAPGLSQDLLLRGCLREMTIEGGTVRVEIMLGYPVATVRDALQDQLASLLLAVPGVTDAEVRVGWDIARHSSGQGLPNMQNVKNIIAVASGKGGVGKSTTAVNLALALAREGARIGILDADIYGPSQPMMLGIPDTQRPAQRGARLLEPIQAHGIQAMSMGFLVTEKTPMVWRGPMVSSALQQLLNQSAWDNLDYLIIDLPPGTGDIQLTLAQKIPVSGAVVVTTPQDIALLDAQKGIEMFRKVSVPVLGIAENMAVHICSECGHAEHLFGQGGGERIAAEYGVPLLGSLPLSRHIREQVDRGQPSVVAEPDGEAAMLYLGLARSVAASLAALEVQAAPTIVVRND